MVYVANGNITPSTFVAIDGTYGATPNAGNRVITAVSGTAPIGVAQKGTRYTPLTGLDTGYAATTGQDVGVYLPGQVAPMAMSAACKAGDWIKPDASGGGFGVTTTTATDYVGGKVAMAAASSQIVDMLVVTARI